MKPLARTRQLLVQEVGDEVVVYDQERATVHQLNHVTAMIWRRCDGSTTVEEIAMGLHEDLHAEVNEDTVWTALLELDKYHLLENALSGDVRQRAMSRRALLMRAGVVTAGGALLLPAIQSIVAPTPAMALTFAPPNDPPSQP